MYQIPDDLDLSLIIGTFTTQISVGQFDIQFVFGEASFAISSAISILKDGTIIGAWEPGRWPDTQFFNLMNCTVCRVDIIDKLQILIGFENGITLQLTDDTDMFECMEISIKDKSWII